MSKQLKVYVLSSTGAEPILENLAREVQDTDVDSMRTAARLKLENDGYTVRTISFTQNNVVAYVYGKGVKAVSAEPITGWVFKRPDLPPTT